MDINILIVCITVIVGLMLVCGTVLGCAKWIRHGQIDKGYCVYFDEKDI